MAAAVFDYNKCKGCELCTAVCPKKIIVMDKTSLNNKGFHPASLSEPDKCIKCGFCALICPDVAVSVEK